MLKMTLVLVTLTSTVAFAGIHDACHSDNKDSRVFAVAYVGAVIDIRVMRRLTARRVYPMPSLNYE